MFRHQLAPRESSRQCVAQSIINRRLEQPTDLLFNDPELVKPPNLQ